MATLPVRFEFDCEKAPEKLKYIHNIPSNLITSPAQAVQQDAGYVNHFVNTMRPIMKEHEAACRAASNPFCLNCGSPAVTILQTPMSWLHNVGDPFVNVLVNPVCGRGECEIQIRQQVQDLMSAVMQDAEGIRPPKPSTSTEVTICKVCGKTETTKRCARCQVVAYCGREHQKADWKVHKKICIPKNE